MAATGLINHQLPADPISKPFQIPAPDLEKMFKASLALEFATDVAPVHLFVNLGRLVKKGYIVDRELLQMLMNQFAKYSRCNGYVHLS
jgi:hypothetical protein